jgi:flagellar export protein FliJ
MSPSQVHQFRLASILRYREQTVEQRQQELHTLEAALQAEQDVLDGLQCRIRGLHAGILAAQEAGTLDCDDLVRRYTQLLPIEQQLATQAGRVGELRGQVAAQRERVLEKLKERQMALFKLEQGRKEGQVLDEIGGVRFHHRQREKDVNER